MRDAKAGTGGATIERRTDPPVDPVGRRRSRPTARGPVGGLLAGLLLLAVALPAASAVAPASAGTSVATTTTIDIDALNGLAFSPDAFTVAPGAAVHLVITQMATFDHTFTLLATANTTIPTSDTTPGAIDAAVAAAGTIANLSLGSTAGAVFDVNFTAPAVGTYEYICEIHFPTMIGTMTVANGGGSSSSGPFGWLDPLALVAVVIGAAAVVVAVVRLRRRRAAPPT